MDYNKRWQETLRDIQKEKDNSYTTEYIEESIRRTTELVSLMIRIGYSEKEVFEMFVQHKRLGKKEEILYEYMLNGIVSPSDSLSTIKYKMDDVLCISRQSWNNAIHNLINAGYITNG